MQSANVVILMPIPKIRTIRSDHCLHHVLPPICMVDNLRVPGHP